MAENAIAYISCGCSLLGGECESVIATICFRRWMPASSSHLEISSVWVLVANCVCVSLKFEQGFSTRSSPAHMPKGFISSTTNAFIFYALLWTPVTLLPPLPSSSLCAFITLPGASHSLPPALHNCTLPVVHGMHSPAVHHSMHWNPSLFCPGPVRLAIHMHRHVHKHEHYAYGQLIKRNTLTNG